MRHRKKNITHIFSGIPCIEGTEIIIGTRGQFKMEFESKQTVDVFHKVKQGAELFFKL